MNPYEIMLLLDAELGAALRGWQVRIVATDLSADSLERARNGVYSQLEVDRGLPPAYRARYFRREGTSWRIDDGIRRLVELRQLNLKSSDWQLRVPPDLVLLRNVLYYFAAADKKAILARVRRAMRPRGLLVLGSTESLGDDDGFTSTRVGPVEIYRPS